MSARKIQSALISVYHKEGLEPLVKKLSELGVKLYSTGGTQQFIERLHIPVTAVEKMTDYPSIFGGRVKTLHPKIFGGILYRRANNSDVEEADKYAIPPIDLVVVDLYPFEETVKSGGTAEEIIEKIDIGGISLIRAAAKNFNDVAIISSRSQYDELLQVLVEKEGETDLSYRKLLAAQAFNTSSHYDTAIFNYFNADGEVAAFKQSVQQSTPLRYGENPHQQSSFYGDLDSFFDQLNGKALSFNNLVDVDAAVNLIEEFRGVTAFAILKHTNACGVATGNSVKEAYTRAFAADTISAFGGILVTNQEVDEAAAEEMNSLFFEVLIAPSFSDSALELLKSKKNRILLKQKKSPQQKQVFKSLLDGVIVQDADGITDQESDLKVVTKRTPAKNELDELLFAAKVAKHTKSNTIVLAIDGQMLASGVGQTSRVDALQQAIEKARVFKFDLQNAVMASDAFFPFPDCVEIANKAGITAVIQPGGSIKDQASIDYCDANNMAMVFTGTRHFKH